jgi:DMSO/TMAO reductase YedYZ molybdopterin-dependent catalytic subunit
MTRGSRTLQPRPANLPGVQKGGRLFIEMTLFLVRHEHEPARCPAQDPAMGAMLLNYLSRPNVRSHGLTIQAEAIVEGEHTLFMIVESPDEDRLRAFLQPFSMAGTVDVYPASTCVRVVASGGCAAPMPVLDQVVPAFDAEAACQIAIDEGLVVHRALPLNCETSIPALVGGVVMPNAHFYVRNHFQTPALEASNWQLQVGGLVERPLRLSLREVTSMRSETLVVTLECAGNGRYSLDPVVEGEQWQLGAVSTAEWTGVPLVEVLDRAGVKEPARELVFRGADRGAVEGRPAVPFERSLPVDTARESRALLAYAMNGEQLPTQHGYPVRLIVPDWYGVASVKWLTHIDAVAAPFEGHFQSEKYWYEMERDGHSFREPVALQRVRALITEPVAGDEVVRGDVAIRGVAWSGAAPIARVEVSVDGGPWAQARLLGDRHRHSWQWWELINHLDQVGPVLFRARATDLAGRTQPDSPEWNAMGYGNNAIQEVTARLV